MAQFPNLFGSGGVGRTGVYIAVDRILQQLANNANTIDVYGTVQEMHTYRHQMIQTEVYALFLTSPSLEKMYNHRSGTISSRFSLQEQYIFIHQCVHWVADSQQNSVYEPVSAFANQFTALHIMLIKAMVKNH